MSRDNEEARPSVLCSSDADHPRVAKIPKEQLNGARDVAFTWTPKVCKIIAFMAIIMGLRLLFYVLLGFR